MVPQSTTSKQDWLTPNWACGGFDSLGLELDVAADDCNALCKNYITEEDDALTLPWTANFWCNPPYRYAGKFLEHGIEQANLHGLTGVFLLRVPSIGCNWWLKTAPFCLTVPISPRIHFVDPQNPEKDTAPHGSMFMIVTPKTIRTADPFITNFQCMTARTSEDIEAWLETNHSLLFDGLPGVRL